MSETALPYPVDEGRTHWEGCYRVRGHHNCAVALVDSLRAARPRSAVDAIEELRAGIGDPVAADLNLRREEARLRARPSTETDHA